MSTIDSNPVQFRQSIPTSQIYEAAQALETLFIAEMLKSAGVGKTPSAFGGGVGEDQFSSFMVAEQAKSFSNANGIGLAEHIFRAMKGAE